MDAQERDQLVSDVKKLQKLTRNLEKATSRISTSNDTVSWRKTLNTDLQTGTDLLSSLETTSSRIRKSSIDAQDDKLLQQSAPLVQKFKTIKETIEANLLRYEPVNNNAFESDRGGTADFGYNPPQQQQQEQEQLEQIGLVSIAADLDHLEEQNIAVKKIAEDVVELKEAFTDLNTLVEEQGDMITHIEDNTEQTRDEVNAATVHLQTAEKHQVAARKKQLMLLVCCLVIIILVFSLLGGFGVFGKK